MKCRNILLTLLFVGVIVMGCSSQKESPVILAEPGDYSQNLVALHSGNVSQLSEINSIAVSSDSVAYAAYYPEKNVVQAIYSKSGFLRVWDITDHTLLTENDLNIINSNGIPFDKSGEIVIGAIYERERENDFGLLEKSFGGMAVWDVKTGKLIACIYDPCDGVIDSRIYYGHAALDPHGRWVISYSGPVIRLIDLSRKDGSIISSIGHGDKPSYIGKIAFDPVNQRFAAGFIQGDILIEAIQNTAWFQKPIRLGDYDRYTKSLVAALDFSQDGNFLARIQDETLTVWNVSSKKTNLVIEKNCVDCNLMAFDWSSLLLFIGKSDHIEIFDLRDGALIGGLDTPDLTSLSVSSDNRILVWGDSSATIHILGVPQDDSAELGR